MGLIYRELKEIRQDIKHYRAGKISKEDAIVLIGFYNQSDKRVKNIIQAIALTGKYGKKRTKQLFDDGIIGNGTVVDLSLEEIEEEKILCPFNDTHLTRAECLDFSGQEQHFEDCVKCNVGLENKKLLLSDTPLYTA